MKLFEGMSASLPTSNNFIHGNVIYAIVRYVYTNIDASHSYAPPYSFYLLREWNTNAIIAYDDNRFTVHGIVNVCMKTCSFDEKLHGIFLQNEYTITTFTAWHYT